MKLFLILATVLLSLKSHALEITKLKNDNSFKVPVSLYESGQIYKALLTLQKIKIAPEKESYRFFLMSKYAYDLSFFDKARTYINTAIEKKIPIEDYAYFMKGLIEWEAKDNLYLAETNFKIALRKKPIRSLRLDIYYHLAKVNFQQKKYDESINYFNKIQRPYRSNKRQPEILWNLANLYSINGDRVNLCKWSRNLYSNFPFSKYVDDWDIHLPSNKVQNKKISCNPTYYEKKRRIKKLLWAGKSEFAKKDINKLKNLKSENPKDIQSLEAEYLLHIGDVEQALSLLLKSYNTNKNDFEYLMLLGGASFKASQYQTAVGSYYKAYQLKSNSRKGKKALFRAAFLSYQFQDYDGSTDKFKKFIQKFPGSSLSKDARYHISWMKYLRGHYTSAISGFEEILADRKKNRRGWRKYPTNRIQYWLAMSYLKLDKKDIARHIFKHLKNNTRNGYYSFASNSRLQQMGTIKLTIKNSSERTQRELSSANENIAKALQRAQLDIADTLSPMNDDRIEDDKTAKLDLNTEIKKEFWSKPKIMKNLARVKSLIQMGQNEWAYRDLKLIEARIKDQTLYKDFIDNYYLLKKYTRASYLTQIKLMPQLSKSALRNNQSIWQSAYPKAFKEPVTQFSSQFSVPEHFVWSIMRAESHYNPNAESQVGAKGLMQLMPYTAREVRKLLGHNLKNSVYLRDPKTNIQLGTRYLSRLLGQFKNQIPLAAAAYNAGPHRVASWLSKFGNLELDEFIEHIPFVETRNYVKRVTRFYGTYNMAYSGNKKPLNFLAKNIPVKISGPAPTKESWD